MPSPNPWPEQDEASLHAFYGSPGDEDQLVNLPVNGVFYEGEAVRTIRCHRKVAKSLGRILVQLAASPHAGILTKYAGCFNDRSVRGGSSPSLHARGAAIDLDPDHNANGQAWPNSAIIPIGVMEIFSREGWLAAGAFWGRDAMHFQATRG